MSEACLSPSEVDLQPFWHALGAGDLDYCISLLDAGSGPGEAVAVAECRLAEALLHSGQPAAALKWSLRAAPLVRNRLELMEICAWVFSNCDRHEEAAAAYLRIVELNPEWAAGYRHASSSLAAAGRFDEALAAAAAASDAEPADPEFALHAARLLCQHDRVGEASVFLARAAQSGTSWAVVDCAELLMQSGRDVQAARLLDEAAQRDPQPRIFRSLSSAEMLRQRWPQALDAIDRAIAGAPTVAEYHIHRGHLLWQSGDLSGAAAALDCAARLDPANPDVKRAQLSLYLSSGLVTEATTIGGALLREFPDNQPVAESVLHLLSYRLDAINGDSVVLGAQSPRSVRQLRSRPGFIARLATQRRVIAALIIRETRTRFGDSKLGYGWALLEPMLHIGLLSATFSVLMHGQPPIGKHFFLFYYTGLVPYHVFLHASSGMSHAITANAPLLQLPLVTNFDVVAARGILEVGTDIVVAVLLLLGFAAIGIDAQPDDYLSPSLALLAAGALGCGMGYINAVASVFFASWEKAFAQLGRLLYFTSGIFYMPEARGFPRIFSGLVSP